MPFVAQEKVVLYYKGERLNQICKPGFICFGKIIVEIKAVKELSDGHRSQVHNYLKAPGYNLGFPINFSHYPNAQIERVVL
ncbi:GxxExxY protein [Desulfobacterium sp. N47]|uniref:GxxExxY protein n=1 Tax=uncultured Desulfobacterium sp. TaxID=201089 RepID=E1YBU1_9BACT|nr:hypothetical protein N47_G33590 [uncultured Desulfobacterium sp.]